jgi:hypothetical protein
MFVLPSLSGESTGENVNALSNLCLRLDTEVDIS